MDDNRFDALARAVATKELPRRTFLQRCAGGLAALLAALGLGSVGIEDAAAKSCKKKCKKKNTAKKRRKCRKRCNKKGASKACTSDTQCTGEQRCLNGVCAVPPAIPVACTDPPGCDGGLVCVGDICVAGCAEDGDCDDGLICTDDICVLGSECDEDDDCDGGLLEICLLGLCIAL